MKCKHSQNKSDPSSPKYNEIINNNNHERSPYGKDEPSTHTTFK